VQRQEAVTKCVSKGTQPWKCDNYIRPIRFLSL